MPAEKPLMDESAELEYAGFWLRVWACLIDLALIVLATAPILWLLHARDRHAADAFIIGPAEILVSWLLPATAVLSFWAARHATPGKMAISAIIVDEKTGAPPSLGQLVGRFLGYFVAVMPLGLGLIWVAFDRKKQGWHDKLAGTLVVRTRKQKSGQSVRDAARAESRPLKFSETVRAE